MEENVIQIDEGIMVNANANVKWVVYLKRIMCGILIHVIVKMENIQQVLWTITYDEIIESYSEETK